MKNFILLLLLIGLSVPSLKAQNLLFEPLGVLQTNLSNPAYLSDHRFSIGVPYLSYWDLHANSTSIQYDDLVQLRSDDSLLLTVDEAIAKMDNDNEISGNYVQELINFGYRTGNHFLTLSVLEKRSWSFGYSPDLINLLWNGNAQFIGETVKFSPFANGIHYREYRLGYANQLSDKLSFGGAIKYLKGQRSVHLKANELSLFTDPENAYALVVDGQLDFRTAGYESYSLNPLNFKNDNYGFGFDLGVQYQASPKLRIGVSVLDIGSINWESNIESYSIDESNPPATFNGFEVDFFEDNFEDNLEERLEGFLDTLKNTFGVNESNNSFSTTLPTKLIGSIDYQYNSKLRIGGKFVGTKYENSFIPAFSIWGGYDVLPYLKAIVSYSVVSNAYANVGLGASIKIGPIQLYAMTENITSAFTPYKANQVSYMGGVNILLFERNTEDQE